MNSTPKIAPLRILLVDDDPLILRAVCVALENDGHRVTAAVGGQAGIDAFMSALDTEPFPVVITDLGMPQVDGRQVSAAIKAAAPATYILLLTGRVHGSADEHDLLSNIDAELGKPPTLRTLREALGRVRR